MQDIDIVIHRQNAKIVILEHLINGRDFKQHQTSHQACTKSVAQ